MSMAPSQSASILPVNLRCEYLINPLGIDVKNPRLYWQLTTNDTKIRGQYQTAYRVLVASSKDNINKNLGDLWDSGKVQSNQNIHVEYQGKQLESEMQCFWKVKVWDKDESESDWSDIGFWTMGLLRKEDWVATWIGDIPRKKRSVAKYVAKMHEDPSPLLRKIFNIPGKIKQAYVYVTALGEYELYVNGNRVGDHILAPEWTSYFTRVQYQTYDVTTFLKEGDNAIGAMFADGWYIGHLGPGGISHSLYGVNRQLLCQLVIEVENENSIQKIIIPSDKTWKIYRDGPIRRSDHFMGEVYDSRKKQKYWDLPLFNDEKWDYATEYHNNIEVVAQMNQPIRVIKEIKPLAVTEPKPGVFIFNLGQNIAGWCKIKISLNDCNSSGSIQLRYGEMLYDNGTLYTENLRQAKATDTYVYSDLKENETRIYYPHFTYHGFQYVEVTGLKNGAKPSLDMITGCLVASDAPQVGAFESSDPTLNKLWKNILWTQWDNMISVPTDCPQRNERMGWMGDAQVFCQTSIFNLDMAAFYKKWILDIRDCQRFDGKYPDFVPFPRLGIFGIINGRATPAWADCGVIVPWRMYQNYADKRIIEEHYESMKKFVNFVHRRNPNLIWRHSTGGNYNDWLNGDTIKSNDYPSSGGSVPKPLFATAYFANSTLLLAKMAKLLGKESDYEKYSDLADKIVKKFNQTFVKEDGKLEGDTQAGYAIALDFDLLPDELRVSAFNHLIKALEKYDNRISTGFCSTPKLMFSLTRFGRNDLAYQLLLSRRFPSWFYMIDQGATTMWERWDGYVKGRGFQNPGMNSFNHYSIGAVGEWMYRTMLGINLDENEPGFKHIIIAPKPGGWINSCRGCYNSIYGKIEVAWRLMGKDFNLEIKIPVNSYATVYIPASEVNSVKENGNLLKESESVVFENFENKFVVVRVKAGNYNFQSTNIL